MTLSVHDLISNHQNTPSSSPGGAKHWEFSAAGLIAGLIAAGLIKEEKAGKSGHALWPGILLRLADLGANPQPPHRTREQPAAEESGLAGGTRGRGVRQARQAAIRCAPVGLPAYQPTTPPHLPARLNLRRILRLLIHQQTKDQVQSEAQDQEKKLQKQEP